MKPTLRPMGHRPEDPDSKQCPHCKEWIHEDASKCPYCHSQQPLSTKMQVVVAIIAVLVAILSIVLFGQLFPSC